jgi:hypothetical protein
MRSMMRPFFLNSYFLCEKKSDKLKAYENLWKTGVFVYKYLYNNKNKA